MLWVLPWLRDNWLSSAVVVRITTSGSLAQLSHSWCEFQFPCPCHSLQHTPCLVRSTWWIFVDFGCWLTKVQLCRGSPSSAGSWRTCVLGFQSSVCVSVFLSIADPRFAIIIDCYRLCISMLLLLASLSSSAVNMCVMWIIVWNLMVGNKNIVLTKYGYCLQNNFWPKQNLVQFWFCKNFTDIHVDCWYWWHTMGGLTVTITNCYYGCRIKLGYRI